MIFDKEIDQIVEDDLQELIRNAVLEDKMLEYKQELPDNSDPQKKEFLADVSSFANSSGGLIIYGIAEDSTGVPINIIGIESQSIDQDISRLDSIIRTGVEPRIPGVIIKAVQLSNSRSAIIIKISKSWITPHRVTFKGHDKFYGRSSNGKYPLNVAELRTAFTLSETITERIRNFREDRISSIYANELPVPFEDGAKIALHIIPISSFNPGQSYDISKAISNHDLLAPIQSGSYDRRYNFEGYILHSKNAQGKTESYVQIYRNGIIELVDSLLLTPWDREFLIYSRSFEEELIESLSRYCSYLKLIEIDPPCFVFMTLLGIKGYSIEPNGPIRVRKIYSIDRDILIIPEVIMENLDAETDEILRPIFDMIWNACGFERSLNYDQNGKWIP